VQNQPQAEKETCVFEEASTNNQQNSSKVF
jgi:hypothetical protein